MVGACRIYRSLIKQDPGHSAALHYLGLAEASRGNASEASDLMRRSLQAAPANVEFIENYAKLLVSMERHDEALTACDSGLARQPSNVTLLYGRAFCCFRLDRPADALAGYDQVLALQPANASALVDRGAVLARFNRAEEALASFGRALQIEPRLVDAHYNTGRLLDGLRRHDEALAAYDRALSLNPDYHPAHNNRGGVLRKLRRYQDALAAYDRVLKLKPDSTVAWIGRGNVFCEQERHDEALAAYEAALKLRPGLAEAWVGCGNVLIRRGRYQDACSAYDNALASNPDLAEGWLGLGKAYGGLQRIDEALGAYDRALALKPDLAEAWAGRGDIFFELKRFDAAFAAYDQAFAIDPGLTYLEGLRLHARLNLCDWSGIEDETSRLLAAVRKGEPASRPFELLMISSSPSDQLQCARRFVANRQSFARIWRGEAYSHERIRLAYLSSDLHEHATAHLAAGLFERHDRSRFETTAISLGPDHDSEMRRRIKGSFERFIDARAHDDQQVAELIRQLEIDIVVDLNGFAGDCRPNILARRPAPVQVNYLGYPGTLGADYFDYVLADSTVIPEQHVEFYSENVVWLPDSYQINDNDTARRMSARTPSRRECALPDAAFVFCCFNNRYKIAPDLFHVWMRLLGATNDSVLWLLDFGPIAAANLCREAERYGVSSHRLIFAPPLSLADHVARYRQADLFLDTLPCNAHTTASDALWAGLPVLTCLGETFAGRVAASVVKAAGVAELITTSVVDYEALALRLARDPGLLAALKAKLVRERENCPLFDTRRMVGHIEAAYVEMWERQQRGEPAARFAVEAQA